MGKDVPFLPETAIARNAAALLTEYARARGAPVEPPILIDDIVEKHLKLGVEFNDMHELFGVPCPGPDPDILGALFFDSRRIVVDESLDPVEHPTVEGRYRFTLAHECGHWRLHRAHFGGDTAQGSLFASPPARPVVCRASRATEPVEWQANLYAACLLMPGTLVAAAWTDWHGDSLPRVLRPLTPVRHGYPEIPRRECQASDRDSDDETLRHYVRPLAGRFLVSPRAMCIRLEQLGLLHRIVPRQRRLMGGI